MREDYKVEIIETSAELSPRDRLKVKDFSNATQLDEVTNEGSFIIAPSAYALLSVHNERSKEDKDYKKFVILDSAGNKYVTGSNSFIEAFTAIWDEMDATGESYEVEIYKIPSKNYKGKMFLTCSIV